MKKLKMGMIGGMTGVTSDVIPYGLSLGNRNYLDGINLIGLKSAHFERFIRPFQNLIN